MQCGTLDGGEIAALLRAAPEPYRALLATALFTGLRQGELLGLRWGDVDFLGLVVRVRHQLGRDGELGRPKTPQATRDVVLAPHLARLLRDQRQAALGFGRVRPEDFVFASPRSTQRRPPARLTPSSRSPFRDRGRFPDPFQTRP
jgi:integrase